MSDIVLHIILLYMGFKRNIYIDIIRYRTSTEIPWGGDSKTQGGEGGFSKFCEYLYISTAARSERTRGYRACNNIFYTYRSAYVYKDIEIQYRIVRHGEGSFILSTISYYIEGNDTATVRGWRWWHAAGEGVNADGRSFLRSPR